MGINISRNLKIFLVMLIFAAAFILYIFIGKSVLLTGFHPIDDQILTQIPQFRNGLHWRAVSSIFTLGDHVDYYPIRDLSYYLDYLLYGNKPVSFRVTNFVFFFLSSILIFFLFHKVIQKLYLSIGLALIWFFLPFHIESVFWISARKDILAIFFIMASGISFLNYYNGKNKFISLYLTYFFYIFSALSKGSFLLLPIGLLAIFTHEEKKEKNRVILLFVFTCIMLSLVQSYFYAEINNMRVNISFFYRLALHFSSLGKMIAGIIVPSWNEFEFDQWGDWLSRNIYFLPLGILAFLLFIFGGIQSFKQRNKERIIYLFLFLLYLPMPSAVFPHRAAYSPRYFEPILLALFFLLAVKVSKIKISNKKLFFLVFLILGVEIYFLHKDLKKWENNVSLAQELYDKNQNSISAKSFLLNQIIHQEKTESANQWLKIKLIKELEDDCSVEKVFKKENKGLYSGCRFFYSNAFYLNLFAKKFIEAKKYLVLLNSMQYEISANILPLRQLQRMNLEFQILSGEDYSKAATQWILSYNDFPDVQNRILYLLSLEKIGEVELAKQEYKFYTENYLLDDLALRNGIFLCKVSDSLIRCQ